MSTHDRKALFLDRDGVININHGYVYQIQNVDFVDGIFDLIKRFVRERYVPVILTNQSGIARGLYTERDFEAVMAYFQQAFQQHGIDSIPVFHCPHHPDFPDSNGVSECDCRKPKAGLFEQAVRAHHFNVENSVMIGDKVIDMIAAERAGVGRRVLFDVNGDQRQKLTTDEALQQPDRVEVFEHLSAVNPR